MAKDEQKPMTREELLAIIEQARRENWEELDLRGKGITELPPEIGQLKNLKKLDLGNRWDTPDEFKNKLTRLPDEIGQLTTLQTLELGFNQLTALPEAICQLTSLQTLNLYNNRLIALPEAIGQLTNLLTLSLHGNQLTALPESIGQLTSLQELYLSDNQLIDLPESFSCLKNIVKLWLGSNKFNHIPEEIKSLAKMDELELQGLTIHTLPDFLFDLTNIKILVFWHNGLTLLPNNISKLTNLRELWLKSNSLTIIPPSLVRLEKLETLVLNGNPLNPALKSAYEQGLPALMAYLRSLEQAEPLYETKLVLVGEGGVGKTTLLKALTGKGPKQNEPTTHGVSIDIHSMHLPHPEKQGVNIQFNAWDFGGQEVYRVTHQFFFSKRSVYLLVWEPRMGVQQCQVEDWLKLIRLRVGDDAKVIIVSTHAKTGERIARIDQPVFMGDFGSMIVDFIEVDSLEPDPQNKNEKFGIAALKQLIADAAQKLEHMGMDFGKAWKEARDELIELGQTQPHVAYTQFAAVCEKHGLESIGTRTLAGIMHDLGYIVYYGDDERLRNDVVLQPEWLTKAIGFVLEDRKTQEMDGILPDDRLREVLFDHPFKNEPKYPMELYPFFLRLMEKYDVSYRLESGEASLVAQHVPQVRPALPWQPEEDCHPHRRRIAMVCVMEESLPGLVPWMIVRTHDYIYEDRRAEGKSHRLHWQKGMFLRNKSHGEAMLELREREFHVYAEAVWPEYFMNVLRQTLQKLITDNWPGLKDRYYFAVPCREQSDDKPCNGRFNIDSLRQFLEEGDKTIRCQTCRKRQDIVELLFGFEEEDSREQLVRIETKLDRGFEEMRREFEGLESRVANYVMMIMHAIASESKDGPRLFNLIATEGNWHAERFRLHLWCEAEGCSHPVLEEGKGVYEFKDTREWIKKIAPYANFVAGVLKTLLPMVAPAVNTFWGEKTIEKLGLQDELDLMKEGTGNLLKEIKISDPSRLRQHVLSEAERSGVLALHAFLREVDPHHEKLGLKRIPTYTGDFLWLCEKHYEQSQSKIPDKIE